MRTRKYDWLDLSTRKPLYGLQIYAHGEWMNAAEDGKPLLFKTPEERDAKRAELRKKGTVALTSGKAVRG